MDPRQTNVEELIKRLPDGYEKASIETKALERRREIKSPLDLARLVFLYLTGGYSQLEISVIATEMGIAKISDTGFLKRFAKCKDWLAWIVSKVKPQPIVDYRAPKWLEEYRLVAIDASDVSEKGRSGRVFRLHYAIDLLKMCALSYKLTSQKVGETLVNFDVKANWLLLADRIYGTLTGIERCLEVKANFILRLRYGAFKLYDVNGNEIKLIDWLKTLSSDCIGDMRVYVNLPRMGLREARICAAKIPDDKLQAVNRRNNRRDTKKQRDSSAESKIMSNYVVIITALPWKIPASEIISVYRLRWQVEIYFKRLKSILDFGNVPLRREDSIFAWLNGKLLVSLLIEQMISEVSFPP